LVVVVVAAVAAVISKSLRQYLSNIPGKHAIKGGEKNIRIVHYTHSGESATVKVQNIFHERNNVTCSANCKYRTAAAQDTLETWFVSGI